jgi:MFS family permease
VSLAALALTAAGGLVLTQVDSVAPLIAGRILQGVGCGLASSALAAYIVDSAPVSPSWLASAVTTGSPMVGLTIGALGSGALAEYGPAQGTLVYLVGAAVLATCALLIASSRETVARAHGAVTSLRPQVRIPAQARRLLPAAASTFLATWALGGFYQALGPSVAADQLHTSNALIAAAVFASLIAPSAIGAPLAGRVRAATAQRLGMVVFTAAVAVILASLHRGLVVPFLLASALAGMAQGATFAGSMRALLTGANAAERAGILSSIYLISYGGAAIPGLIAGQLSHTLSLFDVALGYGALAALACVVTLVKAAPHRPSRGQGHRPCSSPAVASTPSPAPATASPAPSISTPPPRRPTRRAWARRSCTSPPAHAPPGTPTLRPDHLRHRGHRPLPARGRPGRGDPPRRPRRLRARREPLARRRPQPLHGPHRHAGSRRLRQPRHLGRARDRRAVQRRAERLSAGRRPSATGLLAVLARLASGISDGSFSSPPHAFGASDLQELSTAS